MLALLIVPTVLIYILVGKYEIYDKNKGHIMKDPFAKMAVISASIVITVLWAGELSGPKWSGSYELLIVLYWLVAAKSLTKKGCWMKTMPTNVLVMTSGIVQLWMELYTAWIPLACLLGKYYLIHHHSDELDTPDMLFLITSAQSALIWYFKNGECTQGMEIGLIFTLIGTSLMFGYIHTFHYKNSLLMTTFSLMMIVLSVIVAEEYDVCLTDEAKKWVAVSSVVIYFHSALIHMLMFVTGKDEKICTVMNASDDSEEKNEKLIEKPRTSEF